ncbi:hypothetical protein CRYUN_Cryun14cG0158400 [Craigia yunnanensis]
MAQSSGSNTGKSSFELMSVQTVFAPGALWAKETWTKQLLNPRINLILRFLGILDWNMTCLDSRLDKQHNLVEELFLGYFTQGKYIGDREFLLESARKVGVEGAANFLENPNNGVKEVNEELEKYPANISGVPNYTINGKHQLSGGQPPEVFMRAFQVAAK